MSVTEITGQRTAKIERVTGWVIWKVTEFDHGESVMLVAQMLGGAQFSTHFSAEQWREFRGMIAPSGGD